MVRFSLLGPLVRVKTLDEMVDEAYEWARRSKLKRSEEKVKTDADVSEKSGDGGSGAGDASGVQGCAGVCW